MSLFNCLPSFLPKKSPISPFFYPALAVAMVSVSLPAEAATQTKRKKVATTLATSPITTADKLNECAKVTDNVLRLACYDKINNTQTVAVTEDKKAPLDLVKTIATSLETKKATPILATETNDNVTDKRNSDIDAKADSTTPALTMADNQADKTILDKVGVTDNDVSVYSPLSILYDLDKNDPKGTFNLRPHLPMYALPLWYSAKPNRHPTSPSHPAPDNYPDLQNVDSKAQISFKTKLLQDVFNTNADVWFGYTQQFYWQVYNESQSRPFRSSDYQPEFFITQPVTARLPYQGKLRMLGAGLVHESNGQGDPLSRSWNRGYVMGGMEWNKLTVIPRVWFIFPDFKKDADNSDIGDYMGYGDVRWQYNLGKNRTVGGVMRYNPFESKGAISLDYARPIIGGMKAYVQLFHGYGENIQDYNHKDTNIGLGLMFNDFNGL